MAWEKAFLLSKTEDEGRRRIQCGDFAEDGSGGSMKRIAGMAAMQGRDPAFGPTRDRLRLFSGKQFGIESEFAEVVNDHRGIA